MKRFLATFVLSLCILFSACGKGTPSAQIVATTLPIYEFTTELCLGTNLTVTQLITEEISCVHDYSVNVEQLRAIESCDLVILNGMGLEAFMDEILPVGKDVLQIVSDPNAEHAHHNYEHHHSDYDPHIWLMPNKAQEMCSFICQGLSDRYPQYTDQFRNNLQTLSERLEELDNYGKEQLSTLTSRDMITFHDGFQNLATAFDLSILQSIEEESGSEASAAQLRELVKLVREYDLPAIFTEKNGSCSAAQIISNETGVAVYQLDMAISGKSYFDAMYYNIDTLKEALG